MRSFPAGGRSWCTRPWTVLCPQIGQAGGRKVVIFGCDHAFAVVRRVMVVAQKMQTPMYGEADQFGGHRSAHFSTPTSGVIIVAVDLAEQIALGSRRRLVGIGKGKGQHVGRTAPAAEAAVERLHFGVVNDDHLDFTPAAFLTPQLPEDGLELSDGDAGLPDGAMDMYPQAA